MTCAHCTAAVTEEVEQVSGVNAVEVDLDTKRVVVRGQDVSDDAVREAIREAGYEAAFLANERSNTIARLALFAAGLAALAAVAALAGRASGIEVEEAPADAMAHGTEDGAESATGLSDTAAGFRFRRRASRRRSHAPGRDTRTRGRALYAA